jgi:hypothetical protein
LTVEPSTIHHPSSIIHLPPFIEKVAIGNMDSFLKVAIVNRDSYSDPIKNHAVGE